MNKLKKIISNIPGWSTKRKIVVIESDDWGSTRTRSKFDYEVLKKQGLKLDDSNFSKYDSLESEDDLERLFNVLSKHKDKFGRASTITPMCIMANPDFEKIRESKFENYYYEEFTETCKKYPKHKNVLGLWKQGNENGIFMPALHGREHLNVKAWMDGLKAGNKVLIDSFLHETVGVMRNEIDTAPEHLGAFYPSSKFELESLKEIILSAGNLFEKFLGVKPTHFIAPNKESPKELDIYFKNIGVDFLTLSKIRKYPVGNGNHKIQLNWLGKVNENEQLIITRNCYFEPSDNPNKDWVNSCLKDIESAFKLNKPATISTHRVNYIGYIEPKNADRGLEKLDNLLSVILKKWPDVEFMSTSELGHVIKNSKNGFKN